MFSDALVYWILVVFIGALTASVNGILTLASKKTTPAAVSMVTRGNGSIDLRRKLLLIAAI